MADESGLRSTEVGGHCCCWLRWALLPPLVFDRFLACSSREQKLPVARFRREELRRILKEDDDIAEVGVDGWVVGFGN